DENETRCVEPRFGDPLVEVAAGQPALLGVVGEGAGVQAQPGILVLADGEMSCAETLGQTGSGQRAHVGSQRTTHHPQLAHARVTVAGGERAGALEMAVGPQSQDPGLGGHGAWEGAWEGAWGRALERG